MPTCHKCSAQFPNRLRIDGAWRNISSRRYCLSCSPWKAHNTKKLDKPTLDGTKRCAGHCGMILPLTDFSLCRNGKPFSYCRPCDRFRQNQKHDKLKKEAILYKGGKCLGCGYDRCEAALDFHHLDPTKKDFRISVRLGGKGLNAQLKAELDKCVLLCSNCHREVHAGVRDLA